MELVNAACNFEPHESFFSLFSDPRSTRLTRIHLREDLVQDQDLEAIRKQVRPGRSGPGHGHGRPPRDRQSGSRSRNPKALPAPFLLCTHMSSLSQNKLGRRETTFS